MKITGLDGSCTAMMPNPGYPPLKTGRVALCTKFVVPICKYTFAADLGRGVTEGIQAGEEWVAGNWIVRTWSSLISIHHYPFFALTDRVWRIFRVRLGQFSPATQRRVSGG